MSRNVQSILYQVDPTVADVFPPFLMLDHEGFSLTLIPVSGTVNGQFKLQTTDFNGLTNAVASSVAAEWVNVENSNLPAATGAITTALQWSTKIFTTSPAVTNATALGYPALGKWVKLVFTNGSSTTPIVKYIITFHSWQPIG